MLVIAILLHKTDIIFEENRINGGSSLQIIFSIDLVGDADSGPREGGPHERLEKIVSYRYKISAKYFQFP